MVADIRDIVPIKLNYPFVDIGDIVSLK